MIKQNSGNDAVADAVQKKENKKQKFYIVTIDRKRKLWKRPIEKRNLIWEVIEGYVFNTET